MPTSKLIQPTNLHDCEHACSQSFEVLISDVRNIIENGRKFALRMKIPSLPDVKQKSYLI